MRSARTLALLLAFGAVAGAQGHEPLLQARHVVLPQRRSFTVRRADEPIRIERVRAHVKIMEQAAETTLQVDLFNPGHGRAEAVLLLPVPDGAAVSSFLFAGSASEPTARLLPKDEARRVYEDIVRKVRDPALLEFAGYNLVQSSVFPVEPRGRQSVRLTYTHLLPIAANRVDYVLPRSEALDVEAPWEVDVEIHGKTPVGAIYSPSHEVTIRRIDERRATVSVKDDARRAPGPFRLSFLRETNGLQASLFAYPDPKVGGGYFLLLAGTPVKLPPEAQRLKREVTLVLDRSGSMAGEKLDQVRSAALQVIEGLADGEAFNIIDYSTTVASFAPQPVLRDADTVKKARAYLDALRPIGGTNIHDALVEALRQPPRNGYLPLVLFLTDGLPTIGQTSEGAIREAVEKGNVHKRRVFAFGVGHDVNAPLLDRVAETTRATSAYVDPAEDVEVKVADVFKRLYGPVLAGPKVTTIDAAGGVATDRVREPIPATLPDLFEGDQLVLLGQYRGDDPLRFLLEGDYLGDARRFEFTFDLANATTRNVFVARLWASRRITFLIDQIRQAGGLDAGPRVAGRSPADDPRFRELVDEILRLSTEFGILSEYTAFLATEGTDLNDWRALSLACGLEIDGKAVRQRWGEGAVARSKDLNMKKQQRQVDYFNRYLDSRQNRVEITEVQQICDRALFKRGATWVDGNVVADKAKVEADAVVAFGTPEFDKLLSELIAEGRNGILAFKGEILLRRNGKNILVKNTFDEVK